MNFKQQAGDGGESTQEEWSEQFCMSRWCRADRWYVKPDSRSKALWVITENPAYAPWSVAANEPVCPLCGEALAHHVEGVGDIEAELPATIINFLRALDRAA
jgi:hypothetical protein